MVVPLRLFAAGQDSVHAAPAGNSIPWSQIGAKAGADYKGDGLAVVPSPAGAQLRCVFQRLEGEVTREGLWLTSTVTNGMSDQFRIVTRGIGRQSSSSPLPFEGNVSIDGQVVRFTRPGLVEEYTVSMDGVRQDFVVQERPKGVGQLAVQLAVSGAKIESAAGGARLVLDNSGRKIAYNRLHVTDATGKELTARMEVMESGVRPSSSAEASEATDEPKGHPLALLVLVDDTNAVYPVRIDPTFSDANWSGMGGVAGVDGTVQAAVVDGSGNFYIGGRFSVAGDVIVYQIAKWDGTRWSALGSGMNPYGAVNALAVMGSDLYAGGDFTTAGGVTVNGIARWDGTNWWALGSGMNGSVSALAVSGSDVFALGYFTSAGGVAANYIAKWDGSSWSALGAGLGGNGGYPYLYALAASGNDVYAGGVFTTAGDVPVSNVAKWDGSNWSALGAGIDFGGWVYALAVSGNNVYVGGQFTAAGSSPATNIAKWNGSSWSALGAGMGGGDAYPAGSVFALAVSGGDLYAGGGFTNAGGAAITNIARWDGSSWSALGSGSSHLNGSGFTAPVNALAVSGSNVYAGGDFITARGGEAVGLGKWDGSNWWALGSSPGLGIAANGVQTLVVSGSDLYVGGDFTTAGGNPANCIAKWDGTSWTTLGSGMSGNDPHGTHVSTLAVSGSNVYAGGNFTNAGGVAANSIAKWDGTSWTPLGSGFGGSGPYGGNPSVGALAISGSNLYAGGVFTNAGGNPANFIAKWDGSSWSALGSGVSGRIASVGPLAMSGSDLYVGGRFTNAGGSAAINIAKWDGSGWSALGSGVSPNGVVAALAVSGSALYVGGRFTSAGGSAATNIAKWDGSNWSALGSGLGAEASDAVVALAVLGSNLYAGGAFTMAGDSLVNSVAKWDGTTWTPLGSGITGYRPYVSALAVSGTDLYAGGSFMIAGGKVSAYLARAYLPTLPTLSLVASSVPPGGITVSWPSPDTAGFVLEETDTLIPSIAWVTNSASITDDGTNKSVTLLATDPVKFFRLRRP
jgi:hypothetical protein